MAVLTVEQEGNFQRGARLAAAVRDAVAANGQVALSAAEALRGPQDSSGLDAAQARLGAGIKQYDGLDFAAARTALKQAVDLYRKAAGRALDRAGYLKALHYLAAASFYADDKQGAVAIYRDAHAFDPSPPDKALFPPDVLGVYQAAVSGVGQGGSLRVASTPPAEVLVNGKSIGISPAVKSDLAPGHYMVTCRRGGFESDTQWIKVRDNARAEVRTELRPLPKRLEYINALAEVKKELGGTKAGPGIQRLVGMLGTDSIVVVAAEASAMVAVWFRAGLVTNRYRAQVSEGGEGTFATQLIAATNVTGPSGQCTTSSECPEDQRCVDGQCKATGAGTTKTPFYKTWWFWTAVGVGVAGAATGIVLGTVKRSESWTADVTTVTPGGGS